MPSELTFKNSTGEKIPVRLFEGYGAGLAMILPGLRYYGDYPLMLATREVFLDAGISCLVLDYDYAADAEFMAGLQADEPSRLATLRNDGATYLEQAKALHEGGPLIIAGKSLGTMLMGGMGGFNGPMVWLTPSLIGTGLVEVIKSCPGPHFSLMGTRDEAFELATHATYKAIPRMSAFEYDGMDHPWRHEDGEDAAARATQQAKADLAGWLALEVL